jgi:hypothetical protein
MKIVVALNSLGIGGTESYVLTVAEHLDRLAHDVCIYTQEPGPGVASARELGMGVVDESGLPADCDAALVQDAAVSFELADRFPDLPQVFVAHSDSFDPQAPPQLAGLVDVVVALNERVAGRLRGFATERRIVRLRQPIDTDRFRSRGSLPEVPRRALVLSNNRFADRREMLEAACAGAGLELARIGGRAGQSTDPRPALAEADVVIGYGRSILEAMACGRAAYVYDWAGGDGWVTADSYPAIEADGFGGRAGGVIDAQRLAEDLRAYSPSMGPVNRDLIVGGHRANVHVQELLELLREVAPPRERPPAPLREMSRLVRLEWRARAEVHGLLGENANLRQQLLEVDAQHKESVRVAREAAAARIEEVAQTAKSYEKTLSWRLTAPLRAAARLLRRLRR